MTANLSLSGYPVVLFEDALGSAAAWLFSAPAGYTTVVTSMDAGGAAAVGASYLYVSNGIGLAPFIRATLLNPSDPLDLLREATWTWNGDQVMNPGDSWYGWKQPPLSDVRLRVSGLLVPL